MKLKFSFIIFLFVFLCQMLPIYASSKVKGIDSNITIEIDAVKNAVGHNSLGNLFFQEKNYPSALVEYEIAYNLAPNGPMAATYLYNIARCLYVSGQYQAAKKAIQGAIKKDYINITYYNFLADCIIALGENDIQNYLKDNTNPYNQVLVGLIYLKQGKISDARTILDDFATNNPKMLMCDDIKRILADLKD